MKNLNYQGSSFDLGDFSGMIAPIEIQVNSAQQAAKKTLMSASEYVSRLEKNPARKKHLENARKNLGSHVSTQEGLSIKSLRLKAGLSQSAAADRAGIHQSQMAKLESDRDANPTLETIAKLSVALRVSVPQISGALMTKSVFVGHQDQAAQQMTSLSVNLSMRHWLLTFKKTVLAS